MAKRSKRAAVPRKSRSWIYAATGIGSFLSIAILFLATQFQEDHTDHLYYVDESIWREVYMPEKYGYGVMAKKNISRGTLIIREKPILLWSMKDDDNPPSSEWMKVQLAKLSFRQRRSFKALSSHAYPNIDANVARWRTNAFWAGGNGGICVKHSRLNHGCGASKNVAFNWRQETQEIETYAIKDIPAGEELLTEYLDTTKMTRSERQKYLLKNYNFECKCSVCMLPEKESQESDRRITAINELNGQLGKAKNGLEKTHVVNRIWQLTEEEGVPSSRGQLAWIAARSAAMHSDEEATREWAELAEKWGTIELGANDRTTRMVSSVARNPRGFSGWGKGPKMTVERPIFKAY